MRISDWSSDVCSSDLPSLEHRLEATARAHGCAALGIAPADAAPETAARLNAWLADGCHGDMIWMESRAEQRGSPQGLWPDVRSVIALGMNYARSEEHTSELPSLMRTSYAVFCLKKTNPTIYQLPAVAVPVPTVSQQDL